MKTLKREALGGAMRVFVLGSVAAFLIGCATTDRVVLDGVKRAPTRTVEVFKTGEKPTRTYKEIARLSFMGPREDEFKAMRHFVAEGKKLGANAIMLEPTEEGGMRGGFSSYGGQFKTTFVFKAAAIVYE